MQSHGVPPSSEESGMADVLGGSEVILAHARLAMGQALICSKITEAAETVAFGVLHFGDQNITAVVKRW